MSEKMSEKSRKIIDFLKKCNIHIAKYDELDGMFVPRELFLDKTKFQSLSNDILELKKDIYSSGLTAFQKNADKNQKWPLLNIVRQILKTLGYTMNPGRKSDGYTLEGKKKYTRHFVIKKLIKKSKEDTLQL
tara:strand:+ start:6465 stop:6860 length:396 start_codon:yes stop_codon:yes gene_type:complete